MADIMTKLSSAIGGLMIAYAMFQNYFPCELCGPINATPRNSSVFSTHTSRSPSTSTMAMVSSAAKPTPPSSAT
ncbi:UNVERIFIED_CONTAM: hypothetical protein Sangu_3034900 [Sesamum angustifolium]|uniref:Uncharacterized protein n=1 Tax=Sesamum angustifolium TaxID=2727405 RepID=A0AAW2KKK4_9LAMI